MRSYKPKSMFTSSDWRVYRAAYDEASRNRAMRGECGDHIGNDFRAMEFVYQVNPPRFEYQGRVYVSPADMARQRVERKFAALAVDPDPN